MTAPDPQNVPRNPLSRHTSRLCVCRLRETPSGDLAARMTPRYLVTLGFSLLLAAGCLAAVLALLRRGERMGSAVAGGFGAFYLGFALLAFRGTRSRMTVFDRKCGGLPAARRRNALPPRPDRGDPAAAAGRMAQRGDQPGPRRRHPSPRAGVPERGDDAGRGGKTLPLARRHADLAERRALTGKGGARCDDGCC